MGTKNASTRSVNFGKKFFGVVVASSLLVSLQVGVLHAPSAEAAPNNTNILGLSFGVPNDGQSKAVPNRAGAPITWTPPTEKVCYPQPDKVEIDPETKKEIRTPVPDVCKQENVRGATGKTFQSGVATWPKDKILIQDWIEFWLIKRTAPTPLPPMSNSLSIYNIWNGPDQLPPCAGDFRMYNFDGIEGIQLANGVHWGLTKSWRVDNNRNVVLDNDSVEYGDCIFEPVKQYVNTCQIEAGPVSGTGPKGKGLPVQIAPNKYDPTTVSKTVGPLSSTSGKEIVRSKLGNKILGGGFDGLSSKQKAAMIRDCAKENTGPNNIYAQFDWEIEHPGNYVIEGPGARVKCAYSEFMDVIEFNGCEPVQRGPNSNKGWLDCNGVMNDGENWSYDFTCKKIEIECFVEDGGVFCSQENRSPFRLPSNLPADTVFCVFDEAIVNEPNGVTLKHKKTPINVGAVGEKWVIDWGNVDVRNIPGSETNRWTEWHIGDDSSPGKKDLDASHSSQPFKGEFEGRRVLAWEDDKNGVALPNRWATKVDINWYAAGTNNKYFTIYQNRKFTWKKTINMTNWDGSRRSVEVIVPQNCKTQTFTFNLLRNRSSGGTLNR
jgi:hypothetical protein